MSYFTLCLQLINSLHLQCSPMIIDVEKSILSHPVLEEVGVKILVEPMREWNAGLSPVHLMGGRNQCHIRHWKNM